MLGWCFFCSLLCHCVRLPCRCLRSVHVTACLLPVSQSVLLFSPVHFFSCYFPCFVLTPYSLLISAFAQCVQILWAHFCTGAGPWIATFLPPAPCPTITPHDISYSFPGEAIVPGEIIQKSVLVIWDRTENECQAWTLSIVVCTQLLRGMNLIPQNGFSFAENRALKGMGVCVCAEQGPSGCIWRLLPCCPTSERWYVCWRAIWCLFSACC